MTEISAFPLRYWAEEDRPREKFLSKGKTALTDAELLALVIGSGNRNETAVALCQRMLQQSGNSLNTLSRLSVAQLMQFKGIGQVKAITIAAVLEIARRKRAEESRPHHKVSSSRSIFELMQPELGDLPHEEFWIIYLNNANRVLRKVQLSKGGLTGTVVDIRIVFKTALELSSTQLILCHNHPSGSLKPSDADRQITRKLKTAGEQLDIKVLDHVIVTDSGWFSFADDGLM